MHSSCSTFGILAPSRTLRHCIIASWGLTYTESQSLYQNLVLLSSIDTSNAWSYMHCQVQLLRSFMVKWGCWAISCSTSAFCYIVADLKVNILWFNDKWIEGASVKVAGVGFHGTNSIMLMLEWMSTLLHYSCFYSGCSASYKGGSDGVPRWGQLTNLLTTPTVSTWDQFIPNRAWTLINLSPPTALKIQFKGPVTDQNELAFFLPDHNCSLVLN